MKKNGFTFIEILGVITLLALLSIIILTVVDKNLKDSKDTLSEVQIENIKSAASMWRTDNIELVPEDGYYTLTLGELINLGYISDVIDPDSNSSYDLGMLIDVGINDININNEYRALEYIESTGEQYINTEYIPDSSTDMEIEFAYIGVNNATTSSWYPICGERSSSANTYLGFWIHKDNRKIAVNYGIYDSGGTGSESASINIGVKYILKNHGSQFYLNDTLFDSSAGKVTKGTTPIHIFTIGRNTGVEDRHTLIKLYSFNIYENGVLVRKMVPYYRISDNVVGLYDLVENKFYTNSGTGDFLYGELE